MVTSVNEEVAGSLKTRRTWRTRLRNRSNSSFMASLSFRPNSMDRKPPETRMSRSNLPDHASMSSGRERNRRVCPVGAVSNTTTSQVGFSICLSNSSKAKASSSPGRIISAVLMSDFISLNSSFAEGSSIIPKPPKPPIPEPPMLLTASPTLGRRLDNLASGSISSPKSPGTPSTSTGCGPRVTPRESDVEWAGSLDTKRTLSPASANHTAVAQDVVVLPTPPFPPKSNNRAMVWGSGRGV